MRGAKVLLLALLLVASFGRSEVIGIANHNPGNICGRHIESWSGAVGIDEWHHLIFKDDFHGLLAMRRVLRAYRRKGITNVSAIVNRWTGPAKNKAEILQHRGYLLSVAQRLGVKPNQTLDLYDNRIMAKLAHAIVFSENGSDPYPESLYREVFKYKGEKPWM